MKNLTWQNPEQLFVAQELINKVKSKCCGIKDDDNNVRIGDTYELFYWDMDWVSLGKQIADDFSLTFHHVPQNALLLLRNLTRGTDERIFLYKDAKQLWY